MTRIQTAPSCADGDDPTLLSVDEARERILATLAPVAGEETLALRAALGRVLARPVVSRLNVPAHTNSAMDGYAVRSADFPADETRMLDLVGSAWAGRPYLGPVAAGQAVRIMTGAVVPPDCDSVIMQEQVEVHGDAIRIGTRHRAGQNVRRAGEDIAAGAQVFESGHRLLPADIGMLASLGTAEVTVHRKLRVAFFSTGDELRSIGQTLQEGEIYDSNRYTLYSMLQRLGVSVLDMGVVRDDPDAIREAFVQAADAADAIVTSGGVSVGEADHVKSVLDSVGEIGFWKVAMKPGRPLAFGRIGDTRFFGLPGNPVAVMVTFYQFLQPALRTLMGEQVKPPVRFQLPCRSRLKKRPGRTEYQRGMLVTTDDGTLAVEKTGYQGSGVLSSMSKADCFIVLPPEASEIQPGDLVSVEPFHGLV